MNELALVDNSGENSGPSLVPQPHGGALLSSGIPGNRGGPGRPPSYVRNISTEGYLKAAQKACDRIDAEDISNSDLARFGDMLGKYGPGVKVDVTPEVPDAIAQVLVSWFGRHFDIEVIKLIMWDVALHLGIASDADDPVELAPWQKAEKCEEAILLAAVRIAKASEPLGGKAEK